MFTIVVPAHNEEAVIERSLRTLCNQVTTCVLDIMVVCNGCSDRTADIVRSHAAADPRIRLVEITQGSKPEAIRTAFAAISASSAFIAVVDADVVLSTDAIEGLATALEGPAATHCGTPDRRQPDRLQSCRASLLRGVVVAALHHCWSHRCRRIRGQLRRAGAHHRAARHDGRRHVGACTIRSRRAKDECRNVYRLSAPHAATAPAATCSHRYRHPTGRSDAQSSLRALARPAAARPPPPTRPRNRGSLGPPASTSSPTGLSKSQPICSPRGESSVAEPDGSPMSRHA